MSEVVVTISNQNLAPRTLVSGSVRAHEQILEETGADGYLWNAAANLTGMARGRPYSGIGEALARQGLVLATQEAWREMGPRQIGALAAKGALKEAALEAGLAVVFPRLDNHEPIARIEANISPGIPAYTIVHPHGQHLGRKPPLRPRLHQLESSLHPPQDQPNFQPPFRRLTYQPTIEMLASDEIGMVNPQQATAGQIVRAFGRYNEANGFKGVVLDTGHWQATRRGLKFDPEHGTEAATKMAHEGMLHGVQLDYQPQLVVPAERETVATQLHTALRHSPSETPQGQLIEEVYANWPADHPLQVDIEVRRDDILAAGYEDYVAALRGLVAWARNLPRAAN